MHISLRTTLLSGVALLVLWGASWALSSLSLGAAGVPVALGIAVLKALLIVLVFMELVHERFSVHIAFLSALAMIALLVGLSAADVLTRARPPLLSPSGARVTAR